jgi:hypothetical protein
MNRMLPVLAAVLLAATPRPMPFPSIQLPGKPMHVSLQVEVNDRGQVVRVDHGMLSGDRSFDTMTLGNAMQMWIRRPNGTAVSGLYRVDYTYNPRTKRVTRVPSLIKRGGNWAKRPGAATVIVGDMRALAQRAYDRIRAENRRRQSEEAKHLPDINAAIRHSRAHPKRTPKP